MAFQTRYGLSFGSGEKGVNKEKRLRLAADKDGKPFAQWIRELLEARANQVLDGEPPAPRQDAA